jgi:hypothetical protein
LDDDVEPNNSRCVAATGIDRRRNSPTRSSRERYRQSQTSRENAAAARRHGDVESLITLTDIEIGAEIGTKL